MINDLFQTLISIQTLQGKLTNLIGIRKQIPELRFPTSVCTHSGFEQMQLKELHSTAVSSAEVLRLVQNLELKIKIHQKTFLSHNKIRLTFTFT